MQRSRQYNSIRAPPVYPSLARGPEWGPAGLGLPLSLSPCPWPWTWGGEDPAPGPGLASKCGTLVGQPHPCPHRGHLEGRPGPGLLSIWASRLQGPISSRNPSSPSAPTGTQRTPGKRDGGRKKLWLGVGGTPGQTPADSIAPWVLRTCWPTPPSHQHRSSRGKSRGRSKPRLPLPPASSCPPAQRPSPCG